MDLFDLGVMLTICATGGLDVVAEEDLAKITNFSNKCCLIHALEAVNTSDPSFDSTLLPSLLTLRRVFSRISPQAQGFICICMQ